MSRYDNGVRVARLSWCPQIIDFIKNRALQAGIVLERLGRTAICSSALQTGGRGMKHILRGLFQDEQGQDIAEYAVMLAVILVIVVGTVRLIGSNANNVFSQVGSAIQ